MQVAHGIFFGKRGAAPDEIEVQKSAVAVAAGKQAVDGIRAQDAVFTAGWNQRSKRHGFLLQKESKKCEKIAKKEKKRNSGTASNFFP
jgi:hypothetical protein